MSARARTGAAAARLGEWAARARAALETMAGAPDYERYVRHVWAHHPGVEPMSHDEFARDRLARRYDRPGARCC